MFALWRTCQHYSEPHSLPQASAASVESLLAGASSLPTAIRSRQYVARETPGGWSGVGFVQDGAIRKASARQLTTYDKCRNGTTSFSNPNYPTLTAADHPQWTLDLTRDQSGGRRTVDTS